jgi:hypothetical protein
MTIEGYELVSSKLLIADILLMLLKPRVAIKIAGYRCMGSTVMNARWVHTFCKVTWLYSEANSIKFVRKKN